MRTILHVDLNNFYASVECLNRPELKDKNVAVCGAPEDRHGIVLAKSASAKKLGVKTGMTIWEAKKIAPDIVILTANFPLYLKYSKIVRKIFENYTDFIEPFGIDESWLDITASLNILGSPLEIAEKIKTEIFDKTGLTVSIGVSYNKIFAKLGSDIAGANEIVFIDCENYKNVVWPLPCENLLYVGKATKKKLNKLNIFTIGELANCDKSMLVIKLGKWGEYLHDFANGKDLSPVRNILSHAPIKSIGNSMTNYKDINNIDELKVVFFLLAESIVSRLKDLSVSSFRTVHVYITKADLSTSGWQKRLSKDTISSTVLAEIATSITLENYDFNFAIRGAGISVSGLSWHKTIQQDFTKTLKEEKLEQLENCVYKIQKKYGNTKIKKALILTDKKLSNLDIKSEHVIHPENFFRK